ncbi:hypothetical protein [Actinoplanes subglobosus]|uniref:Uncharacterized protein n=1 Tax=Actinoplanes subglobosus TaxID=1547892 RepID=A0ABV8IWK8_9ACTN
MKELGIGSLASLISGVIGMPWQAVLAFTVFAIVCATVVSLAKTVIPQESADRVLWADKVLKHRALRASRRPSLPPSTPRPRAGQAEDQVADRPPSTPGTAG